MIGLFLINPENELAFAQFGQHVRIEGFRYIRDARLCMVRHSVDQEELFTNEQPPIMINRLSAVAEILVAHIDEAGQTIDEYTVPVEQSG